MGGGADSENKAQTSSKDSDDSSTFESNPLFDENKKTAAQTASRPLNSEIHNLIG